MKKLILPALATLALTAALMAAPTTGATSDLGEQLYKKCAGCHGSDGSKAALGVAKPLKGLSADELTSALMGFKAGTFGGPKKVVMERIVQSLSPDDIKSLAGYISGF